MNWVLLSFSPYSLLPPTIQRASPRELSPIVRNQALPQSQLAEDVHDNLHGGEVSHSEGAEIQDVPEFQGGRGVGRHGRRMLGEINDGRAHNPILFLPCIFYLRSRGDKS